MDVKFTCFEEIAAHCGDSKITVTLEELIKWSGQHRWRSLQPSSAIRTANPQNSAAAIGPLSTRAGTGGTGEYD